MKKIIQFRFWIAGGIAGLAVIVFGAYHQHLAAEKYQHHRAEYCSGLTGTIDEKKTCIEQGSSPKDFMDWRLSIFSWPEGIEALAIIATGAFIAWQAWETRKAAIATENASKVALRQINLTKEKERARLEVKSVGILQLRELPDNMGWYLEANIEVRNIGVSKAFTKEAAGYLLIQKGATPPSPEISDIYVSMAIARTCVDPTGPNQDIDPQLIRHFPDSTSALGGYANKILAGEFIPIIRGEIAYETLGLQYVRHFAFDWHATKGGLISMALGSGLPKDNAGKIAKGYWAENADYGNEDREITEAQKPR